MPRPSESPTRPLSPAGSDTPATPAKDVLLWVGVVVWILCLLPSLVGVLGPDATLTWADEFDDVPILLLVLLAMGLARHASRGPGERIFWGLLMGCPLAWLLARVLYLVVPYGPQGMLVDQVTDLSYLLGYLCVVLALEFHPLPAGRAASTRRVEWLGMLLYGFFLLSYFTLAPSIFRPELYETWVSSMLLFAVMDLYLLIRVWSIIRRADGAPGLAPTRWLGAVFFAWLAGDLVEGLMYMGVIPYTDPGTPADVLWMAPGLLLLVSARSRTWGAGPRGGGSRA